MAQEKSKINLITKSIEKNKQNGIPLELNGEKNLQFNNIDFESIRPKKQQVEYASVKIRTGLYLRVKEAAEAQGIKQPGKFISLILEKYLEQADS